MHPLDVERAENAAGNVMDLSATVIGAAAQGVMAAAAINADLVAEDTRRAVITRRDLALALVGGAIRLGEGLREDRQQLSHHLTVVAPHWPWQRAGRLANGREADW